MEVVKGEEEEEEEMPELEVDGGELKAVTGSTIRANIFKALAGVARQPENPFYPVAMVWEAYNTLVNPRLRDSLDEGYAGRLSLLQMPLFRVLREYPHSISTYLELAPGKDDKGNDIQVPVTHTMETRPTTVEVLYFFISLAYVAHCEFSVLQETMRKAVEPITELAKNRELCRAVSYRVSVAPTISQASKDLDTVPGAPTDAVARHLLMTFVRGNAIARFAERAQALFAQDLDTWMEVAFRELKEDPSPKSVADMNKRDALLFIAVLNACEAHVVRTRICSRSMRDVLQGAEVKTEKMLGGAIQKRKAHELPKFYSDESWMLMIRAFPNAFSGIMGEEDRWQLGFVDPIAVTPEEQKRLSESYLSLQKDLLTFNATKGKGRVKPKRGGGEAEGASKRTRAEKETSSSSSSSSSAMDVDEEEDA